MGYKEKYEQALERAREQYNKRTPLYDIESIFPELKETEDERIRKALTEFLKSASGGFLNSAIECETFGEWLDWIEKQSEKKSADEVLKIRQELYQSGYNDGYKHGQEDITKSLSIGKNINHTDIKEKAHQIAWETSKDYDPQLSKESWCEMAALDMASWLEKQSEKKPTDNVKPRFKVGDWVLNNVCFPVQIASIKDSMYIFTEGDAMSVSFIDENFHLWTIHDAMDGDVLVCKGNIKNSNGIKYERICLFNNLDNAFFTLTKTSNNVEEFGIDVNIDYPDNTIPATKGQKEILFMAMKEEGYEWDADKKELKKIEPKTLDADKVIEWLKPYGVLIDDFVNQFKKDFGLC